MSDICERLRKEIVWEQEVGKLLEEAAAEIELLRQQRNHWMSAARHFDEHLATFRVMLMEQPGVRFGASDNRETVHLTDEEREAVEYYIGTGGPDSVDATLLALLSRTGTPNEKTADDATECTDQ